jgi:hypothetical protein
MNCADRDRASLTPKVAAVGRRMSLEDICGYSAREVEGVISGRWVSALSQVDAKTLLFIKMIRPRSGMFIAQNTALYLKHCSFSRWITRYSHNKTSRKKFNLGVHRDLVDISAMTRTIPTLKGIPI